MSKKVSKQTDHLALEARVKFLEYIFKDYLGFGTGERRTSVYNKAKEDWMGKAQRAAEWNEEWDRYEFLEEDKIDG